MGSFPSINKGFENLRVYQLAEKLADCAWIFASGWDQSTRDTVGRQLIRAADGIEANTAEGTGREGFQGNRRFVRNARGSLYETRHWFRRAHAHHLMSIEAVKTAKLILDELGPRLNACLRSIGPVAKSQRGEGVAAKDK